METINTLKVSRGYFIYTFAAFFRRAMEQEIIAGALQMFNRYGIRSVTMDDVAKELSISKKTIYKHFENKADLIHRAVRSIHDRVQEQLMRVQEHSENAIDELFEINEVVGKIMESHNPLLRFQLQKYYPKTYNHVHAERHGLINKMIAANIEKGKRGGWFRKDAITEIHTYLYCSKVESLPEEEEALLKKYSMKTLARQTLEYHVRGLATEKGLNYLNEKLKQTPTE